MKKYLFIFTAVSVLFACAKENPQNDLTPGNEQGGNEINGTSISFTVEVENSDDVKATISSNTNFTWEESDRVAVYTEEGTKIVLAPDPASISGGVANFSGAVPSGETVAEDAIVVYPADFLTGSSTVTFPDSYSASLETKGQGTVLAAKVAAGRKLNFKYLAATMKATITDVPSIATSITVSSTAVLTGAHSIDFSGSTPTMSTSSSAKTISFTSPSAGNNVLIVPVPTTGSAQTFTYTVKYGENTLFSKSTEKTLARNSYMSMAELAINPTVYMLSNMTGWSGENLVMGNSAGVASTTIGSRNGMYFRVKVKYPYNNYTVEMGPSSGITEITTSGSMNTCYSVGGDNPAVLISNKVGNYSISFNYLTGGYTISESEGTPSFFAFGHNNSWSMTTGTKPLTNVGDLFFILGNSEEYKINMSTFSDGSSIGSNGNNNGTPGANVFGNNSSDDDWYYTSVMYNGTTDKYYVWNEGKTNGASSHTNLYIRGSFNSWSSDGQIEMAKSTVHNHVWYCIKEVAKDEEFKVMDGGSTWFDYSAGIFAWNTTTSGTNAKVSVAGKYMIVFNDLTGKYNIILTTA